MMTVVYNSIIPFKGFKAITFFPFIFVRGECKFSSIDYNHELIHCAQQEEMLNVGIGLSLIMFIMGFNWLSLLGIPIFFVWYLIEYLIRLIQYRDFKKAYRNISFEREAYENEGKVYYMSLRKDFHWLGYI